MVGLTITTHSNLPFSRTFHAVNSKVFSGVLNVLPPVLLFSFKLRCVRRSGICRRVARRVANAVVDQPRIVGSFSFSTGGHFISTAILSVISVSGSRYTVTLNTVRPCLGSGCSVGAHFRCFVSVGSYSYFSYFGPRGCVLIYRRLSCGVACVTARPVNGYIRLTFFSRGGRLSHGLHRVDSGSRGRGRGHFMVHRTLAISVSSLGTFVSNGGSTRLGSTVRALFSPDLCVSSGG